MCRRRRVFRQTRIRERGVPVAQGDVAGQGVRREHLPRLLAQFDHFGQQIEPQIDVGALEIDRRPLHRDVQRGETAPRRRQRP